MARTPNQNQTLYVYTIDHDKHVDKNCDIEFGTILSRKHNFDFPMPDAPTELLRLTREGSPPVKHGSGYVFTDDPAPADDDDEFVFHTLPLVNVAYANGDGIDQRRGGSRNGLFQGFFALIGSVSVALAICAYMLSPSTGVDLSSFSLPGLGGGGGGGIQLTGPQQ